MIYCLDTIGLLSVVVSMTAAMQRVIVRHCANYMYSHRTVVQMYVMLLMCAMLLLLSNHALVGFIISVCVLLLLLQVL